MPWESSKSVPLCNPELKTFIVEFTVQIQSSQRDETTDEHYLPFYLSSRLLPGNFSPDKLIRSHHWQKGSKSCRAFPRAKVREMNCTFWTVHKTLANARGTRTLKRVFPRAHVKKLTAYSSEFNMQHVPWKNKNWIKNSFKGTWFEKLYLFLKCSLRSSLSNVKWIYPRPAVC